jgi:carbon-monoxide dehydrogenase large subunit
MAVDAAELVIVDYEPLAPLVDPREAAQDEVLLHPSAGTNTCVAMEGDFSELFFADCEVVVQLEMIHQRMAPCPIEPRAATATWEHGRLTYWASTAEPHGLRSRLAQVLGLDERQVRVLAPEVGGAFGAKGGDYPEELVVGAVARRLGRPVKWVETRSDSMVGLYHGRALVQRVELGGLRDGSLLAYRIDALQDSGAYPTWAPLLVGRARVLASGAYAIPRIESRGRAVVTSTTPVSTLRGAGRPEANIAIERAVDSFAAEIGMDPAAVRAKNLIPAETFPHTTATGSVYDSGDYHGLLNRVLASGDYEALREEQSQRRAAGDPLLLGVGLGLYVEISDAEPLGEYAAIEIAADGRAIVSTGASPHGQGHETVFAQLVASRLGMPMDLVEVCYGDTDRVPVGIGSFSSRTAQAGGSAIHRVSLEVLSQAQRLVADVFEVDEQDVSPSVAHGGLVVAGSPTLRMTWQELAEAASARGTTLAAERFPVSEQTPAWPSGATLAVIDIDSETGVVTLRSLVTCDDVGRVLNPLIVAGQIHGGLALGVSHALVEEFIYDEWGNPLTGNFGDYAVITADRVPRYILEHISTPSPGNDLGAKGVGEAGTVGAPAAILNAVVDALSHLGVKHLSPPATPERVLNAIHEVRGNL